MEDKIPEKLTTCLEELESNLEKINLVIKKNNIKQRFSSVLISIALMLSGWFVVPKIVKDVNTIDYYPKTTKTYSTVKGLKVQNEYSEISDKEQEGIYLKVYGKTLELSDNMYDREVTIYNVTDIDLNNFSDYLNIDLEKTSIEGTKNREIHITNLNGTYLKEGYREVEEITIDKTKKEGILDLSMYNLGLIISYLIYITCLCYIEVLSLYNDASHIGIINNLIYILKNKDIFKEKELLKFEKEILILIAKDKIIRERFYKLYEENIDLLNNKKELLERINDLTLDDVQIKQLTKIIKHKA